LSTQWINMDGVIGALAGTILGAMIAFIGSRLGFVRIFVYMIAFGPQVTKTGDIPQKFCRLNECDEISVHIEILYSSSKNVQTTVFDPFFEIITSNGITKRFPLAIRDKVETTIPILDSVRAISLAVREDKQFHFEIIISQKEIVDEIIKAPNLVKIYIEHRRDAFWLPPKLMWRKKRIRKYFLCEKQNPGNLVLKETEINI